MDELNFDYNKDIQGNFYSDDFDHLNIYGRDENGNTSTYRDEDNYFDTLGTEDTLDFL